MNRHLRRAKLDQPASEELLRMLRVGPWCWPAEGSAEYEHATALTGIGAPDMRSGLIPLVCVGRELDVGHLLALELGAPAKGSGLPFGRESERAWNHAAIALPRSLPILWQSAEEVRARPRSVVFLTATPLRAGRVASVPSQLSGDSFGLAFLLAMASSILQRPLREDVVASARLEPTGAVGGVEGLAGKIAVVEEHAPRVRRIMVAEAQRREAERLTTRLEVVPVPSAAWAVRHVFDDAFEEYIARVGEDRRERSALVESFVRLAICGERTAVVDWTPVENGARRALDSWTHLGVDERWQLSLARAIAARHEGHECSDWSLPDVLQLEDLPRPLQIAVVTQLFQSWADMGFPARAEAERYGHELACWEEPGKAFPHQLRLSGARARGLAVTGEPSEALVIQERVASGFSRLFEYDELTYQLSECYRLAAALEDREAFDRIERMHQHVRQLWSVGHHAVSYVDLARARAVLVFDAAARGDAITTLIRLRDDATQPAGLRWSAARSWAATCADAIEVERRLAALASQSGDARDHSTVAAFRALCDLDRALAACDVEAARTAAGRLVEVERWPARHLLDAANAAGEDPAAYVARFYPY